MPIPDFQTLMLPFLQMLNDSHSHSLNEIMNRLANDFKLTPEELTQMVPTGQMSLFKNRVSWTRSHLKNAGLIYYPERGMSKITPSGIDFLNTKPSRLRMNDLMQFPSYKEWRNTFNNNSNGIGKEETSKQIVEDSQTPQEKLGKTIEDIHNQIATDLLDVLKTNSFQNFEKFVIKLLQAMGYGGFRNDSARVTGMTGDNGIDGVIQQDVLGLESVGVQAKRYVEGTVGSPDIRNFIGSLAVKGFSKGVFLTTSSFSDNARKTAEDSKQHKIILIDGKLLAQLAITYNVGVQTEQTIVLKKIDMDFFEDL